MVATLCVLLVWCADSGAYFVGRKLGRRKMAPNVSPNKSMEGLAGGLITGLLVVVAISVFKLQLTGASLVAFVALSALTILASVLGDLLNQCSSAVLMSKTLVPSYQGMVVYLIVLIHCYLQLRYLHLAFGRYSS